MICTLQYAALFCVLGCPNHVESLSWDRSVGSRISFLFFKYFLSMRALLSWSVSLTIQLFRNRIRREGVNRVLKIVPEALVLHRQ
jgi:hypothetical protein